MPETIPTIGGILAAMAASIGINLKVSQGQVDRAVQKHVTGLLPKTAHDELCALKIQLMVNGLADVKDELRYHREQSQKNNETIHRRLDELFQKLN